MQHGRLAFGLGKTSFYVSRLFILRDDLPAGQIRCLLAWSVFPPSLPEAVSPGVPRASARRGELLRTELGP